MISSIVVSIIIALISGIVSGLIACLIFWRYTLMRIPNIEIVPKIAKNRQESGKIAYHYLIKIRNRGKRDVIDMHIFVLLVKEELAPNRSPRLVTRRIPAIRDYTPVLSPLNLKEGLGEFNVVLRLWDEDFLKKLAASPRSDDEKFREKINKNIRLEDLLTKYDYLRTRVICTDPTSNIKKVFSYKFYITDIAERKELAGIFDLPY